MTSLGSFKYVYIPSDVSEPVQELSLDIPPGEEQDVSCLLDHLKVHFKAAGPRPSAAVVAAQKQALLAQLGDKAAQVDARMLDMVSDMQMVENISLLAGQKDHGHVSVNMYTDDMAQAKELPFNPRASAIAECCGRMVQVRGDAFIARIFDDEESFKRLDFTLPELASDAPWVKAAKQQVEKREKDTSGRAFMEGLKQGGMPQAQPAKPSVQVKELGPADIAKEEGNAAAKRGDWAAAAAAYGRALEMEPSMVAAANNLGLALLKLGRHADAEAVCSKVLAAEPRNVKALLRRASACEAQGDKSQAATDFAAAVAIEPQNPEARAGLERLAPPPPPQPPAGGEVTEEAAMVDAS